MSAEAPYRSLVDRIGAIVWDAVPGDTPGDAHFSFVSEGTEALLGYPAEAWLTDPRFWFDITHPADRERVRAEMTAAAARGAGDFEYRSIAADGRIVWLRNIVAVEIVDGERPRMRGVVVDVTERRSAQMRLERVQQLSEELSRVADVREVAAVVARQGRAAAGALAVAVFLRFGDELEISGYDGHADESIDAVCRVPLDRPIPAADVVRSGKPLYLSASELAERYPGMQNWRRLAGDGPFCALPLQAHGRVLGALAVRMPGTDALREPEVLVLDVLARTAAQAVARAEHAELERAARDRAGRMHAVAAALAEALTPADVAAAILAEMLPALDAFRGSVWQVAADGDLIDAIGWRGVEDDVVLGHSPAPVSARLPVCDALRRRAPVWLGDPDAYAAAYPELADEVSRGGMRAVAAVPLISGGRGVGAIMLGFTEAREFTADDRDLIGGLGALAAQALERARLYDEERHVAVTLQRSLLPAALPELPGVEIAVRYLPAAGLEAGGDFYEALSLPGGGVGIAVGDVVGRGALAAAAMGQLRSALRAFAMDGASPAEVLTRLSRFAVGVPGATGSTAIYATLDRDRSKLRYACAGHPWPLAVTRDGRAAYLEGGRGIPLGIVDDPHFAEATATLEPGSMLLLYTDGLTDRRTGDGTEAFGQLRDAVAARHGAPLDALLGAIARDVGREAPVDDVALVAVRLGTAPAARHLRFAAEPRSVPAARREMRAWLREAGTDRLDEEDLLLAAGEAVANAVEHAYAGSEGEFELHLAVPEPGVIEVVVRDSGSWRTPVVAPERGRGIGLMQMLTDAVDLSRSEGGTTVRLVKRLGGGAR